MGSCIPKLIPKAEKMSQTSHTDTSPVRQLIVLINQNASILEAVCSQTSTSTPDLNEPFHPSTEAFRSIPVAAEAANVICAAALQLAAILMPPQVTLYHVTGGVSLCLRLGDHPPTDCAPFCSISKPPPFGLASNPM